MKTQRKLLIVSLVALSGQFSFGSAADIEINEVVSSNKATIADENGDYSDWIELHNTGSTAVDLAGWGLTDQPATPFKWLFPAISLEPDAYLLVWASSKDRTAPTGPLHTNFAVSASGESVALTEPSGTTIDLVAVPVLPADVSFGRKPGQGDSLFYFETPTPAAANTTPGYPDLTIPPTFSQSGGFYTEAFSLEISSQPGWTIYYTMDGSDPDPSRVDAGARPYRVSHAYTGPVSVASRAGDPNVFSMIPTTGLVPDWLPKWKAPAGEVFKATVIRAVATDPATGRTTDSTTRTFFVDPGIHERYGELPIISVVSDYIHLFDNATGIYVPGVTYGTNFNKQNFVQDWKRPASVEYFEADGTPGFNGGYEISNQGSTSPASPQKALNVIARAELGPEMIGYPVFAGAESRANQQTSFKRIVLRSWGSAINWPVCFADAYNQTLAASADQEIQDYRPAVVFINGEYWGLHGIREHNKNSWYHQGRTGIDRDDPGFDLLEGSDAIIDEGDAVHWNETMAFIDANPLSNDAAYDYVTTRIDVANFAEYMVHCAYAGKRDWPDQNEAKWRPRTADGKWRWTQVDMDHGLSSWAAPEHDMLDQIFYGVGYYGPHPLFLKLMKAPRFKALFIDTYADWLNSRVLRSVELARFDAMRDELAPFMAEVQLRWPGVFNWASTGYGRDILSRRNGVRRLQLRNFFNLGADRTLMLQTDPSRGVIRCNRMIVDSRTPGAADPPYPWTGTYFQNKPVTLEALPRDGNKFIGWHVRVNGEKLPPVGDDPAFYSEESVIQLSLTGNATVEAVFEVVPVLVLHGWDFESGTDPFPPTVSVGGGTLAVTPSDGTSISSVSQGFLTSHLRVNNPLGTVVEWSLPTSHYESLKLDFLTRRSGSGAGTQTLSYTTDGLDWTIFQSYSIADDDPQPKSFDFVGVPGVNDNPLFAVKIEFSQGGGGTGGNNRFDDVVLTGVALPRVVEAVVESSLATDVHIAVSPADKNGESDGVTTFTRTYQNFTTVHLTAPLASGGYLFQNWQRDGVDLSTDLSISLAMDNDLVLTAVYAESPPLITGQPVDQVAGPGGSATFQVSAEGSNPLFYQWRFMGIDIDGANSATLTINPVGAADEGVYTVMVSNSIGSATSNPATLTLVTTTLVNGGFETGTSGWTMTGNLALESDAPYVPSEGSSLVSFNSGNSTPNGTMSQTFATRSGFSYLLSFDLGLIAYNNLQQRLEVVVSGDAELVSKIYTMQRVGNAVVRWEPKSILFTADSSATTLTFRDRSTTTNSLDILVDNVRIDPQITRVLTVESSNVGSVPVAVSPSDNNGQASGSTPLTRFYQNAVVVNVSAPAASAGHQFVKWTDNGADLSTDPVVSVSMNGDHSLVAVYVEGPPVITTQPVDVAVAPGAGAIFHVVADGTGPLSYRWRFMGVEIPGGDQDTLMIGSVQTEHAGTYDVVVSNAFGPVTSNPARLSILTPGLVNGSFEADYTGWTHTGNQMILVMPQPYPYAASDGVKVVVFNKGNTTPNAVLSQSFVTTPGQAYVLTFNMGILSYNNFTQRLQVDLNGASPLASETFSMVRSGSTIFRAEAKSMDFTANSPTTTLTFRDVSPASDSLNMTLDNVCVGSVPPPGNRAPVAMAESYSATQDIPLVVSAAGVLANDTDADANPLTAVLNTGPSHGVLVLNPDGGFSYTPAGGYVGEDSFTYHANDGSVDSNVATVSISVNAVYVEGSPVITSHPVDVAVGPGAVASFRVVAEGAAPLFYQWRFMGVEIPGEDQDTLTILSAQTEHAGTYDVVVSNGSGVSFSHPAVLSLVTASVVNGSYENDYQGWRQTGNQKINSSNAVTSATDGTKYVTFNSGNAQPNGVLSQSFSTIPGASYTLLFDAGVLDYVYRQQRLRVTVSGGGSVLDQTITLLGPGKGATRWTAQSFVFVADADTMTVVFRDVSTTTNAIDLLLDHVRVAPSPTSSMVPPVSSLARSATAVVPPREIPIPAPLLLGQPGDIQIRLEAAGPGAYVLECSENLKTWRKIGQMTLEEPGSLEFRDTTMPARGISRMFYRIGRLPDGGPD